VYGVRGVGKSTWARETFPDGHIIDLLDESRYQALVANPALLGLLRTLAAHRVVVLDEVQRVPALLNEVHRAIEGDRRRSPPLRPLGIERAPPEDRRHERAGWARGAADHVSAGAGRIGCGLRSGSCVALWQQTSRRS
jgi:hypothetical protein